MYSDIWMNDKSLRKNIPIEITAESNIEYRANEKDEIISVAVNFEFADDVHFVLTRENWILFLQKVLHLTDMGHMKEKLAEFLKGDVPYLTFEESLEQEKIEYKKVTFFDSDFEREIMKGIIQIQIKGCSGYCPVDMAYEDVLTLTHNEIRYEYKPEIESDSNPARKWKYQTNSPEFRLVFDEIADKMPGILQARQTFLCTDVGMIDFTATYEDKTKKHTRYWCTSDEFSDCFTLIKKLVPSFETIPNILS